MFGIEEVEISNKYFLKVALELVHGFSQKILSLFYHVYDSCVLCIFLYLKHKNFIKTISKSCFRNKLCMSLTNFTILGSKTTEIGKISVAEAVLGYIRTMNL